MQKYGIEKRFIALFGTKLMAIYAKKNHITAHKNVPIQLLLDLLHLKIRLEISHIYYYNYSIYRNFYPNCKF